MVNFVICDDETHMLEKLSLLFEKVFIKNDFDAKIVLKTTNYNDILEFMSSNLVNVVVLDIEFHGQNITGLDIAEKIRKINKDCYLIFTTSHFEYIMQAYQFKTFDYLIKNAITIDLLSNTLTRLFEDISQANNNFFKIDNKGTFIDLNDIQFIEKNGMKIIFHASHNNYEAYNSFLKIEKTLPNNFVRCHKSFIANINNISHISFSENIINFKNEDSCFIGPKYKNSFMEMINHDSVTK